LPLPRNSEEAGKRNSEGGIYMRYVVITLMLIAGVIMCGPSALANPSMLPDHPGYQMGAAVDPVHGLSEANDPGKSALDVSTATREAAAYDDVDAINHVVEVPLSLESQGAGVLPKTIGYPDIKIEPPVSEALNPK
jgi:hypothetical protein